MTTNHPSRMFYLFIIGLVLYAIFPFPGARWLGQVADSLVVPISDGLLRFQMGVRPERPPFEEGSPEVIEMKTQLAQAETRIAHLESRTASLVRQIQEFDAMYRLDASYRYLRARRVKDPGLQGGSLFQVNAGARSGVETGTVVLIPEMFQLVGRVTRADRLMAVVTPITAKNAGPIRAVLIPEGASMARPDSLEYVTLEPQGDGTFEGKIDRDVTVKIGDSVRLRDAAWGDSHTGLLIGVVTHLKPYDPQPLHQIIVVQPTTKLSRLPEVMLKVRRDFVTPADERGGG